jgi:hypothetical protein
MLPTMFDVSGTIYNSDDAEPAGYSNPASVFAIYFSEPGGLIVFTVAARAILTFVLLKSL